MVNGKKSGLIVLEKLEKESNILQKYVGGYGRQVGSPTTAAPAARYIGCPLPDSGFWGCVKVDIVKPAER